ncbi:MAG TPA: hypothetical protein PLN69_10100 [bacterium]|nr:hypothetical protein [bacterium]
MFKTKIIPTALFITLAAACRVMAFNVIPMTVELDLLPGENYTGRLMAYNSSSDIEMVKVYPLDFDKKPDGGYAANEAGTLPRSCANWMEISPTGFEMKGGIKNYIKYTLTVPDNATGSYWTYIMIEGGEKPEKPSEKNDRVQFAINSKMRVAVRIVINVIGEKNRNVSIENMKIGEPPENGKFRDMPLVLSVLVNNSGNTFEKINGVFEIRSLDGDVVDKIDIKNFSMLPEHKLWKYLPVSKLLPVGDYVALVILDHNGDSFIAGETRFTTNQLQAAIN